MGVKSPLPSSQLFRIARSSAMRCVFSPNLLRSGWRGNHPRSIGIHATGGSASPDGTVLKESENAASAIDFLTLCRRLKTTKRKGWINHGIKGPESIADHMYRMALMALIAGDLPGVSRLPLYTILQKLLLVISPPQMECPRPKRVDASKLL
ncbi:hypothetical protein HPP92_006263 [Vanilla planifolia]|uniref:HD domain-containing protein n=1 Tax=Vanilla planifolia TaxID=51239 RepID=A0A835VDD8_VANPL|nr:hypothetical protein HPP92_006263 [Vanilla planifolia]